MTIYRPPSVKDQPDITLLDWCIFKILNEGFHFCGRALESKHDGRVSSKIVSFNRKTMVGITRSGRKYHLTGQPGMHPSAVYVFHQWLSYNNIEDVVFYYQVPETEEFQKLERQNDEGQKQR